MDNDQLRHYSNKLAYEIDAWDLKHALDASERVIVVDARSAQAYAAEHIPGAISLPHRARAVSAAATDAFCKLAFVTLRRFA